MGNDDEPPFTSHVPYASQLYKLGASPGPLAVEDTLPEILLRKERELMQRADALRGMLHPVEHELEQVRIAMRAIGVPVSGNSYVEALGPFLNNAALNQTPSLEVLVGASFTIKQMIVFALRDHYHHGATPSELSEYMRIVYAREVDRNSISPQLARLRDDGVVDQPPGLLNEGKWALTQAGRRYNASLTVKDD
jgi:hypothetical protein